MKTSENRFSRQKHAHKQRKKGLSCHHALPRSPQPPQEPRTPSIVSTVFNSPNGPVGPKRPKSHNGPKDGCSPSIPIPQLFVKNLFLCTAHKMPMSESVETVALVAIVAFVLGIHCDHAHLAHQTHHHDDAHNRYKSPTITLYYEIRCKITFSRNIQPAYY